MKKPLNVRIYKCVEKCFSHWCTKFCISSLNWELFDCTSYMCDTIGFTKTISKKIIKQYIMNYCLDHWKNVEEKKKKKNDFSVCCMFGIIWFNFIETNSCTVINKNLYTNNP